MRVQALLKDRMFKSGQIGCRLMIVGKAGEGISDIVSEMCNSTVDTLENEVISLSYIRLQENI